MSSEDVLGFLGRKLHPSLQAQVVTDTKRRPQGWRIRHRMAGNWVKVYDKVSVLRVETTINTPREFRIARWVTNDAGRRERRWCPMRKGVSDLWRTFQVGIAANHRYLDALAAAPLHALQGFRNTDITKRLYPRPAADANASHGSSSSSAVTAWSPRSHAPAATASPDTANAS
jgi:hypothetical protein